MSIITPEEYRRRTTKIVSIGEGLNFKVRCLTLKAFNTVVKMFPESTAPKAGESPEEFAKRLRGEGIDISELLEHIPDVLVECVVEPPLVKGPGDENHLSVNELSGFDQLKLFFEIMKVSGLTEEALKELESFRPESSS